LPVWDHWYELVVGVNTLRQGDLFRNLLVYSFPQDMQIPAALPAPGTRITGVEVEWGHGDWIILSASCDVDRRTGLYPHVVVGRVLPVGPESLGSPDEREQKHRFEVIRKGLDPSKFLLPECPTATPALAQSIVQYRVHLTMPADYLRRNCTGERLRLRHPLREVFGNWVGTNISRVGPENDLLIPPLRGVGTGAANILSATESE
jgi:hypothetical protein